MKKIPLVELDGELTTVKMGERHTAIIFRCPVCGEHSHLVPYSPTGGRTQHANVWRHTAGSTIEDITVEPSYMARADLSRRAGEKRRCRLHCFIRDGVVQILGDSKLEINPTGDKP